MGKLIVSMNLTIDGYLAGANAELDWHCNRWTSEMSERLCTYLSCADTILLGRITYEAMMAYWTSKIADPFCSADEYAFASIINRYPKTVFSNSLSRPRWANTTLVGGLVAEQIRLLKNAGKETIMVYGSSQLVQALIYANLVDEYHLWLHPVVIGGGKRLFSTGQQLTLRLINNETFSSGVTLLHYRINNIWS